MNNKEKKYSFPIKQTYSKEFLKENFWKCLYTYSKKQLDYWVILPNNIQPVKLEPAYIEDLNLTTIGQYIRTDNSPYLEIQFAYEYFPYEMNASDWLKNKLAKMGEEILEERVINGKSTGYYLDCLCRKQLSENTVYISRYTVLKDYDIKKTGANYILIKVCCKEKEYEELALTILQVSTNWDLSNKSDWQMAELLNPFTYEFIEPINFFNPISWEIKANKNNNTQKSHFILEHTIDNKNKGIVNAFFYNLDTFHDHETVFNYNFNRYSKLENFISEIPTIIQIKSHKISNPSILQLLKTEGTIEIENNFKAYIFIYLIKTLKGWYYFESIGPRPNFQNFYFEINKRTIELIVDSFNNLSFDKKGVQSLKPNLLIEEHFYKIYKGKKYTKEEWEVFEQKEFEKYARKHNISLTKNVEKGKLPPSRFLFDE